jgi:5'-nucleotidase
VSSPQSPSLLTRHRPLARLLAVIAAAVLLLSGAVSATAHTSPSSSLRGLKILLTNDDSMQAARPNNSDGLGLYEVRRALCAAGADVVVIAPWQVQSGRGTAVTNSGTFRLGTKAVPAGYENDCAGAKATGQVYGLCLDTKPCTESSGSATPSDTVKFATRGGLKAVAGWDKPDLVVSGSNSGNNLANSVTDSGTVGATVAAIEDEIPAVALSSSGTADFSTFPLANYRATAEWGTKLIAGLRSARLLDQHDFALNVNYPNVAEGGTAKKAVWASIGDETYAYHGYVAQSDGSYKIALSACSGLPDCTETKRDADVTWLLKGHITVVPINWDRTYGERTDSRTLAKVRSYVEHKAPRP